MKDEMEKQIETIRGLIRELYNKNPYMRLSNIRLTWKPDSVMSMGRSLDEIIFEFTNAE